MKNNKAPAETKQNTKGEEITTANDGLRPTHQPFRLTHCVLLAFSKEFGSVHVGYVFKTFQPRQLFQNLHLISCGCGM